MNEMIIAVGSAIISAISTMAVTKMKSSQEKDVAIINTESERISVYMDNLNVLLDRYQIQIDDLRKEVKALTNENRKLRLANQELVDQIAEIKVKFNINKDKATE